MINSESQFCSKAWSKQLTDQWIGSWTSLNDSFSSLPHVHEAVLKFQNGRQNIKSVERSGAWPVPRAMHLPRHNQYWYFQNIYACRYIGYICLHFAEQTEFDLSMCICLVMFRCLVAVMWGVLFQRCVALRRGNTPRCVIVWSPYRITPNHWLMVRDSAPTSYVFDIDPRSCHLTPQIFFSSE